MKKLIFTCCLLLGITILPSITHAQTYPDKPIRMIVPFGAGSSTDILTRGIAKGLAERLGQAVVVENRAGAGGNIGANSVARAAADGYTLVMGTNGPFAANASLYSNLPYDPLNDFTAVALMGRLPMVLIANSSAPVSSLEDLIKVAKAHPGKLNFGASNTTARVWVELLKRMAQIDVETILYSNVGGMLTDLMGGQISYAFENVGPSLPLIQSGKVKALAVTSPERAAFAPEVSTVAEAGLAEHELVVWFALFAPKDTPSEIVNRLNIEVNEVLKSDEIAKLSEQIGMTRAGGTPKAMADYHASEVAKWRSLVQLTGVRIN